MNTSDYNLPLFPKSNISSESDPLYHETIALQTGYLRIAGVDEAGRGPLAGPVVAAAVVIPVGKTLEGIKDSKQMKERAREAAFNRLHESALGIGIGVVSHQYIDEFNILKASLEAMRRAVLCLEPLPDFLLVDGIHSVPLMVPQRPLIKGDQISLSISAASVIAKVYRDRIMTAYHEQFPWYGFHQNKGYGTASHRGAIEKYGPSPIHRLTFRGVCRLD